MLSSHARFTCICRSFGRGGSWVYDTQLHRSIYVPLECVCPGCQTCAECLPSSVPPCPSIRTLHLQIVGPQACCTGSAPSPVSRSTISVSAMCLAIEKSSTRRSACSGSQAAHICAYARVPALLKPDLTCPKATLV